MLYFVPVLQNSGKENTAYSTVAMLWSDGNLFVFGEMILRERVSMVELQPQNCRQT
jgi:hypothetical protein